MTEPEWGWRLNYTPSRLITGNFSRSILRWTSGTAYGDVLCDHHAPCIQLIPQDGGGCGSIYFPRDMGTNKDSRAFLPSPKHAAWTYQSQTVFVQMEHFTWRPLKQRWQQKLRRRIDLLFKTSCQRIVQQTDMPSDCFKVQVEILHKGQLNFKFAIA